MIDIQNILIDYSNNIEKSIAGAECVIAPVEMKSTPVAAICARFCKVTLPEASIEIR